MISLPNQQQKLVKDTNKTQTAQNTKAAIPTEIPYPSRKTNQTGSVALDSLTPFWWDLQLSQAAWCCWQDTQRDAAAGAEQAFPQPQTGAVRGHRPPPQPVTGVSHPTIHSSHVWAGGAALASWTPPLAELDLWSVRSAGCSGTPMDVLKGSKMGPAGAISAPKFSFGMNCYI